MTANRLVQASAVRDEKFSSVPTHSSIQVNIPDIVQIDNLKPSDLVGGFLLEAKLVRDRCNRM